jgi:hypothetical protein
MVGGGTISRRGVAGPLLGGPAEEAQRASVAVRGLQERGEEQGEVWSGAV